jgi:hypothetical protein
MNDEQAIFRRRPVWRCVNCSHLSLRVDESQLCDACSARANLLRGIKCSLLLIAMYVSVIVGLLNLDTGVVTLFCAMIFGMSVIYFNSLLTHK